MAEGGRRGPVAIAAVILLGGALFSSSPALAQANGDPGSALLGIARAQAHAVEKSKAKAAQQNQQTNTDPSMEGPTDDNTQSVANDHD